MKTNLLTACGLVIALTACHQPKELKMGSYAYDARFLAEHGIQYVELTSSDGRSKVMLAPDWQGRVVTSSADGDEGDSYGWINYQLIESGEKSQQFNPVGGEERFWLGPEGGPYSLYFADNHEQVYANWKVPAVIDTEPYEVDALNDSSIVFKKHTVVKNTAGTAFDMNIERTVTLLSKADIGRRLNISLPNDIKMVGYESRNKITNTGSQAWTKDKGLVSVWMLGQFNPTTTTTVFIPYNEKAEGRIVNDAYFGKIPADRLKMANGLIYFKIDGKLRSKLGVPPTRSKGICGSYDSQKGVLTIVRCESSPKDAPYLNGQWGEQKDPFDGDMLNSYNDGPVEDGSIMGPFYEIETSSPGAPLAVGASLLHTQETIHIQAAENVLDPLVKHIFGADLKTIKTIFAK